MDRRLIVFILLILLIGILLGNVNGFASYKWIPLRSGDKLPENATLIGSSKNRYLGRARHFDEILPAEVLEDGSAFISSCHRKIQKDEFEILTIRGECEWKTHHHTEGIEESIVRVGTGWNGEPIFVGVEYNENRNYDPDYYYNEDSYHTEKDITSIYFTKREPYSWLYEGYPKWKYLSCDTKTKWVDSSSRELPNNTIFGGYVDDKFEMYVAQLKRGCAVVTGKVIPDIGIASALLKDGTDIEAAYCQVLVGEPNEYSWIEASDGEIPDYAVVNGQFGNELEYVAQFNNAITHLTYSEARELSTYAILVMNQP